jgi:O-acetyl-ADP-ribose deacetylase (regulator of RNase III)
VDSVAQDAVRQDVVEVLGTVGGVEVAVAVTSEPWSLPVDALVLSVGRGLGRLARDAQPWFPDADWESLKARPVPIGQARVLEIGRPAASVAASLRFFIAAGVGDGAQAIYDAIGRASAAAVRLAQRSGVSALAMPLLGTGSVGLELGEAARIILPAVGTQLRDVEKSSLRRLIFVGEDGRVPTALTAAWRAVHPEQPEPARQPPSSGQGGSAVQPPSARLPYSDLSSSAVEVLGHATAVAEDRPDRSGEVDGPLLLLSALTRRRGALGGVSAVLGRALAGDPGQVPDLLGRVAEALSVPLKSLDREPVSPRDLGAAVNRVVDLAREYARRTGATQGHLRHLLAAVVTEALPPPVMAALETTPEDLRGHLRAAIRDTVPDESPSTWDEILQGPVEAVELAGGHTADVVVGDRGIPLSDDHLGIGTYVTMLASVITTEDTQMPLSVGLFGEWGSGKSYFMGLLRHKIDELAGSDPTYTSEIVQITFNAWHYADTNLWASLGNEIFRQLAGPPNQTADQQREALRTELAAKLQRAQQLEAAKKEAEDETARVLAEIEAARAARGRSVRDFLAAVATSATFQGQLAEAWKRLGVNDEAEQGRLLLGEVQRVPQDVQALHLATSGRRGWIAAVVATVALGLLAIAAFVPGDLSGWLARGGLGGLAALLAAATITVARVRSGMQLLTRVAADVRKGVEQRTETAVAAQVTRLREAEAQESVLQANLDEVLGRVGEIGRELATLSPGQRLYGFVSERATSEEYRRELGLISTIRRDFEELIVLMEDWRENPKGDGRHRPIDRIVLYIDDLDRCSPQQVVDVLQAVHLLLALNLFVVVVGVDPRWLLHSLRERYRTVFSSSAGDGLAPVDADEEVAWRTTPKDYLEKIFNVPFVLPGLSGPSFESLIRSLSTTSTRAYREPDASPPVAPPQVSQDNDVPAHPPVGETPEQRRIGSPVADVPVEKRSQVDAANKGIRPEVRGLVEEELRLLAALAPLVRTPREAKRLMNLYRMVRSTRDLSPAARFLGGEGQPGEFEAVIILLGLLTAHPRLLGQLLAAPPGADVPGGLCSRAPDGRWADLVTGLTPKRYGDGWRNDVGGSLTEDEREEWEQLVGRVGAATALVTLPDLRSFQLWGPRVARFSFVLSPLAAEEPVARPIPA